jgi:hypothetical protein
MSEAETEHGALLFETLRMVDKGGTFLKACDSELRQAVQLTQERGGKAVLSIKLVVKLAQGKQMVVEPSVAATVPKPMTMGRLMYAGENGALLLDDPDQMLLDLDAPKKVVPVPESAQQGDYATPRKVNVKTN